MQGDDLGRLGQGTLRRLGEGVAQSLDDLEQAGVGIGQTVADQPVGAGRVFGQYGFEPVQELRDAVIAKRCGAPGGLDLLIVVVGFEVDRVVGVVRLGDQIGDG